MNEENVVDAYNKLLNAVIITMIGKHNPTAPKAAVPIFGILAI